MPQVSIARLFEDNREKLKLEWIAGREGSARELNSEPTKDSSRGLIGHLNVIHPNLIQVLGPSEVGYLEGLDAASQRVAFAQIYASEPACLIVAGVDRIPAPLIESAESAVTAVLRSPVPSVELMWMLRPYLARALAEATTAHGVFLDVLGMGVLIKGDSGVGKSELALELISRGSGLVADDVVELYRIGPETVEGRCPELLKNFLEVRGLGVLNIRSIFGEAALRPRKNLKLIVQLERLLPGDPRAGERLPRQASGESILGIDIRKVTLPVAAGRNLAVLTEAAVRSYVLQLRGADSTEEFIARQAQKLQRPES